MASHCTGSERGAEELVGLGGGSQNALHSCYLICKAYLNMWEVKTAVEHRISHHCQGVSGWLPPSSLGRSSVCLLLL